MIWGTRDACRHPRTDVRSPQRPRHGPPKGDKPIYATIRIYSDAEGRADAVAEHEAEILGLFKEVNGFRDYYMVKTGAVGATSVTVCDDQAGAEATNGVARDFIVNNLTHLSVGAPELHGGEVTTSA